MIKLKTPSTARWEHFGKIKPTLGIVIYDLADWLYLKLGRDITITSMIRPKLDDSGIHAEGRAVDIAADFDMQTGEEMMDYINKMYVYDVNRLKYKTIIRHESKAYNDNALHYHIQVRG